MRRFASPTVPLLRFFVISAPLLLFLPALASGKALFWGLPAAQFIPWKWLAYEQMKEGILPLWNPFNGMGAPLLANYQLAIFYPAGWLSYGLAALGGVAWLARGETLVLSLHLCWAAAGMMALLRRWQVGLRGELISGLAFGLCGYMVARAEFFPLVIAASWLPWVMLTTTGLVETLGREAPSRREIASAAIKLWGCVTLQLLAGHAQVTFYTLVLAAGWALVLLMRIDSWKMRIKTLGFFAGILLLAAAASAIQLAPTAEYLLQSQRAGSVDEAIALVYSFWPWRFLTLLFPNFFGSPGLGNYWGYANFWEDAAYIGVLPLLAAAGTLVGLARKKNRSGDSQRTSLKIFLWTVTIMGFILALGKNTPIFPFLYRNIPTFDMFNGPARFLIWFEFGLAALAGLGIDEWTRPTGRTLFWARLAVAGSLAVAMGAFLGQYFLKNVNLTFIPAAALGGGLGAGAALLYVFLPEKDDRRRNALWTAAAVLLTAVDLWLAGWYANVFIDAGFFAPSLREQAILPLRDGERIYLPAEDEYRMKFDRFFTFKTYFIPEDWANLWASHLPDTNILSGAEMLNNFDPLVPARFARLNELLSRLRPDRRERLLEELSVTRIETVPEANFRTVVSSDVQGKSRYRLYTCARTVENEEAAWRELSARLDEDVTEPFDPLIIETPENLARTACAGQIYGSIQVIYHAPDHITLLAETDSPGWLEAAETFYPGWKAFIDGKPSDLYPSNGIFKAVRVEAGRHRIDFVYQPVSIQVGAAVSLASLIFVLIVLYLSSRMK